MTTRRSNRRSILKSTALLGAGLLPTTRAAFPGAREAAGPKGASIIGSWVVQVHYDNSPVNMGSRNTRKRTMAQFLADGRWVGSESAVERDSSEAWPVRWKQATYHGEWAVSGHDMVELTGSRLFKDDSGALIAITSTTVHAQLARDGDEWDGRFQTKTFDAAGTELAMFTGSVKGRRM